MSFDKNKALSKAQKLIQQGKLEKAIEEYQRIVDEEPSDVRTHLKIGDLNAKLGNIEVATETYKKVAEHYAQDGFFLKAIAVFKQILKLDPGVIHVYLRLAELYNQLGLNSEAMKQYQIVVKHYENKGMKKESLDVLQKMSSLDPENLANKVKLAELYAKEGYKDQAVIQFNLVAKELKEKNNFEDLIKVLEKMVSMNPNDRENLKELSAIYLKVGEPKKALAKLQLCFKTDPKDPLTLELLAQAFVDLQQPEKSKSVYRELIAVYEEKGMIEEKDQIQARMKSILPEESFQASVSSLGSESSSGLSEASKDRELLISDEEEGTRGEEVLEIDSASKVISEVDVYMKYGLIDKALENLINGLEAIKDREPLRKRLAEIIKLEGSKEAVQKVIGEALEGLKKKGKSDVAAIVEKALGRDYKDQDKVVKVKKEAERAVEEEVIEEMDEEILLSDENLVKVGEEALLEEVEKEEVSFGLGLEKEEQKPLVAGVTEAREKEAAASGPKIEFPEDLSGKKGPAQDSLSVEISDSLEQEMLRDEQSAGNIELAVFDVKPEKEKFDLEEKSVKPKPKKIPEEIISSKGSELKAESIKKVFVSQQVVGKEESMHAQAVSFLDKYKDEIEEADFFIKQGLLEEARDIYESIAQAEPEFSEAKDRLAEIEALLRKDVKLRVGRGKILSEDISPVVESVSKPPIGKKEEDGGLFNLGTELANEIQEINKAALESQEESAMTFEEMFSKFKQGVEKSLAKDDYQAHYDLGVAYKEMGLLDAAICEFKIAIGDESHKINSISMIGLCFLEKGNYENAIKTFEMGLGITGRDSEKGLSFVFDMAEALYKKGDFKGSLSLLEEIRVKKPAFRNVIRRISEMEKLLAERAKPSSKKPEIELESLPEASGQKEDKEEDGEDADSSKKNKISYI